MLPVHELAVEVLHWRRCQWGGCERCFIVGVEAAEYQGDVESRLAREVIRLRKELDEVLHWHGKVRP
jgi:hypothetical protein